MFSLRLLIVSTEQFWVLRSFYRLKCPHQSYRTVFAVSAAGLGEFLLQLAAICKGCSSLSFCCCCCAFLPLFCCCSWAFLLHFHRPKSAANGFKFCCNLQPFAWVAACHCVAVVAVRFAIILLLLLCIFTPFLPANPSCPEQLLPLLHTPILSQISAIAKNKKPLKTIANAASRQPSGRFSATAETDKIADATVHHPPLKPAGQHANATTTTTKVSPSDFSGFISDLEASPSFIAKNNVEKEPVPGRRQNSRRKRPLLKIPARIKSLLQDYLATTAN
ncbi:UNVERIFIED_CONTAM: hypothetical protein Sindi_2700900 [Sesamum indicum]